MNLSLDYKVLKYKHIGDKWFYLYEMTKDLWCVVVYADDEETLLFSAVQLTFVEALHLYNKIKDGEMEIE